MGDIRAYSLALSALLFVCGTGTAHAAVFRADRATAWNQFRHGGGLNDVVIDPALPPEPAWRFGAPIKGTSTSPVVAGNLILIASNDRFLRAVDARSGREVWRWHGDNDVMTAPVYRGDIVVVGTGDPISSPWDPPRRDRIGQGPNDVDGIDLKTGKQLWSTSLTGSGMPMPALIGNRVLHVDGAGVLTALEVHDGRVLWTKNFPSDFSMTNVLVSGSSAYFGGGFPAADYAVATRDGATRWVHRFPLRDRSFDDCPLATDGRAVFGMYSSLISGGPGGYIVAGSFARQHVYALDAKSGRTRWDTALPITGIMPRRNESAIPMYTNGTVYDGSSIAPYVTALDARTGRIKWSTKVSGPVKSGLVLTGGVLYFGDLAGRLWALDARTGHPIGSVKTDLTFNVGSPIALNGSLIIGSKNGPVVAIPLALIRQSRSAPGVAVAPVSIPQLLGAVAMLVLCALILVLMHLRDRDLPNEQGRGRSRAPAD